MAAREGVARGAGGALARSRFGGFARGDIETFIDAAAAEAAGGAGRLAGRVQAAVNRRSGR